MAAKSLICAALRIAAGAVFIAAGSMKVFDTPEFATAVHHYQLTPWVGSVLIALYVPWLEIIAGLAAIIRHSHRGALLVLMMLTCVFLVAILSAWARDLDITCGCFGPEKNRTNYPLHVFGNLMLLAALAVSVWPCVEETRFTGEGPLYPVRRRN